MSGHFDEDMVRAGAYGHYRCEHGALRCLGCDLCDEELATPIKPAAEPAAQPADTRIQIGPLDV